MENWSKEASVEKDMLGLSLVVLGGMAIAIGFTLPPLALLSIVGLSMCLYAVWFLAKNETSTLIYGVITGLFLSAGVGGVALLISILLITAISLCIWLLRKNIFIGVIAATLFADAEILKSWICSLLDVSSNGFHSIGHALLTVDFFLPLQSFFGIAALDFAAVMLAVGLVSLARMIEKRNFGWHSGIVLTTLIMMCVTAFLLGRFL